VPSSRVDLESLAHGGHPVVEDRGGGLDVVEFAGEEREDVLGRVAGVEQGVDAGDGAFPGHLLGPGAQAARRPGWKG
jgi:hypothetical protein